MPKAADVDDDEAEPKGGGLEDCLRHSVLPWVVVVDAALNGWEDHLEGVHDEVGQPQEDAKQPCPVASYQGHLQASTSGECHKRTNPVCPGRMSQKGPTRVLRQHTGSPTGRPLAERQWQQLHALAAAHMLVAILRQSQCWR